MSNIKIDNENDNLEVNNDNDISNIMNNIILEINAEKMQEINIKDNKEEFEINTILKTKKRYIISKLKKI